MEDDSTVAFCDGGLYAQNMEADKATALIQGPDSDQKTGGYDAADEAQIFFVFSAFFRGKIFG